MCLWLITDIYKIILLIMLKAEMYILFLNLHLNSVISQTLKRMKKSDMIYQIKAACTVIRRKLCQREQNYWISLTIITHFKSLSVNWTQFWILLTKDTQIKLQNSAKRELLCRWKAWWAVRKLLWEEIETSELICKILKLHKELSKTQSFIMIQLWSDKMRLTAFLY